jgi:hypothetical protein
MSTTVKLDGFAGNKERRQRFVSMYASEAIAKGQVVALDLAATEPTNGYGNHVKICDTGDALNRHAIGVATDAIASGEKGTIQVGGYCDFAQCDSGVADGDEGDVLVAGAEAGEFEKLDSSEAEASGGDTIHCALLIEYGTDGTADSIVFLLNPANL